MSGPYWSKLENNRKGSPKLETLKRVQVAFDRVGKPLTDRELLELFTAALASIDISDKLAHVRYGT